MSEGGRVHGGCTLKLWPDDALYLPVSMKHQYLRRENILSLSGMPSNYTSKT